METFFKSLVHFKGLQVSEQGESWIKNRPNKQNSVPINRSQFILSVLFENISQILFGKLKHLHQ